MRIALLERKLGIMERFGVAYCPLCEDSLRHFTDESGKVSVVECPKCSAKPEPEKNGNSELPLSDPDEGSGNV
jgi:Zn ribbon nucleic-acid-binding protein